MNEYLFEKLCRLESDQSYVTNKEIAEKRSYQNGYSHGLRDMNDTAEELAEIQTRRIAELEKELETAKTIINDLEQCKDDLTQSMIELNDSLELLEDFVVSKEDLELLQALKWATKNSIGFVKIEGSGQTYVETVSKSDIEYLLTRYTKTKKI